MAYNSQTPGAGVGGAATTAAAPLGTTAHPEEERKLQKQVNEEYHDPMDDWSIRDVLLALIPFIISYAFKDTALRSALAFGTAWAWWLLIFRTVSFDSRRKTIWPLIDIISALAFPILLGLTYVNYNQIHRWWNIILPAIFGFAVLLSLLWRRPFSAHYGRYPKFDRGGTGLWHGDASYRRTSDMITAGWFSAFAVTCLLSLIPILTEHWRTYHALNVIFNYIVPAVLLTGALIMQQVLGMWYRSTALHQNTAATGRGAGFPSGMEGTGTTTTGAPATYSSTAV